MLNNSSFIKNVILRSGFKSPGAKNPRLVPSQSRLSAPIVTFRGRIYVETGEIWGGRGLTQFPRAFISTLVTSLINLFDLNILIRMLLG